MTADAAPSLNYCEDLVRRLDEDRWLAAQYARPEGRGRLIALYALHIEIERAPAMVSEAALGEIRLQWWREALEEIGATGPVRAHPVIEAARNLGVIGAEARDGFENAIDARARLLYEESFRDVEDLEGWLRATEGYLVRSAARTVGAVSGDALGALEDAAAAFALARYGARLAPGLERDVKRRAAELADAATRGLRALPAACVPAALHFALTRDYIRSRGALSPLSKRLRLFVAMATGRF